MTRAPALLLLAAGCSMSGGGDDSGNDGAPACEVTLSIAPADPEAGATIVATAVVSGGMGLIDMSWSVTGPDGAVAVTPRDADWLSVELAASTPGVYQVSAAATRGGDPCSGDSSSVNVRQPGAAMLAVRLRYTPVAGQPAPPQDDPALVTLWGGADMSLPSRTLDGGVAVAGTLGAPAGRGAAYVRFAPAAGGNPFEAFADAEGGFTARLPSGSYDVSVVPYDAGFAPVTFLWDAAPQLELTLDPGQRLDGVVVRADGTPVAGARVAIAAGPHPPAVATTAGDGAFTARALVADGPIALRVVPPDDAGLPGLELPASAGLAASADALLEIRLADAAPVTIDATVVRSTGAPLAGARVSFVAEALPVTGSVAVDGGAAVPAAATVRIAALADAGGALAALPLPAATYAVVVEPPVIGASGEAVAAATLDLATVPPGAPVVLATSAAAALQVDVTAAGAPVAGARVVAVSRGILGIGAGSAATATTGADGAAMLSVAPAQPHDVVVDPPRDARLARAVVAAQAPAAAIALPAAIRLSGTVLFPSGAGQAGVRVQATCDGCPGPLAETVTGAGGTFVLWLPDPGVM